MLVSTDGVVGLVGWDVFRRCAPYAARVLAYACRALASCVCLPVVRLDLPLAFLFFSAGLLGVLVGILFGFPWPLCGNGSGEKTLL